LLPRVNDKLVMRLRIVVAARRHVKVRALESNKLTRMVEERERGGRGRDVKGLPQRVNGLATTAAVDKFLNGPAR